MMRIVSCLLLGAALAWPAAAQEFPLGATYKAISISGFDVQKAGMTLSVARAGDGMRGSGHAGCNGWNAQVVLRDDQIDFGNIATTKKFCGQPRMKSEQAFLTSLRSARRWRVEGQRLIIEGEAARLLLTSAAR